MASSDTPPPSPFAYILSFLIVGLCWGFTTPFIRRAALTHTTPTHPSITDPRRSWLARQIAKAFFTVVGLLRSPGYAVPLLCNLTGSVWFFLLVGKAGKRMFPLCGFEPLAYVLHVLGEGIPWIPTLEVVAI
jgi:Putative transmembrane family 234